MIAEDNAKILLVEDQTFLRQALANLLETVPGFAVVAQAGSLAQARETVNRGTEEIDVAVVDLHLPNGDGVELIREISTENPDVATLVLTASLVPAEFARVVEAGAAGFLHKSADTDDIIGAVRRLRDGEAPLSPDEDICMLRAVTADRQKERRARISIESLTPRELQILEALAEGLDSKEIAQRLSITPETERTHMKNLLQKLGANSRLQALVFAARLELVEIRANPQELAEIR